MDPFGIEAAGPGIRTATVLIVDTVESVATKERLGQDRADAVNRKVERLLRKAVSTSGGTTVKGLGDGVLAVFPSASAALRAACSTFQGAAALNDTSKDGVTLRGGVAVGDVVFEDDDIKGLAVDEASRLQTEAPSNGVLLSGEVYLLARGRTSCVLRAGPELHLKGIERPVQTYEIDWAASPETSTAEVELPSTLATELRSRFPFAGRRTAIEALGMPVLGEPSTLTIVRGPTGVGKTRLLAEWAERARHTGAFVFYYQADSDPTVSLQQLATAIREFLPSPAHARLLSSSSAYRQAWGQLTASAAVVTEESIEEGDRRKTAADLVTFLSHVSADSPTIFIVDNVQHGSDITLDFIDTLLKAAHPSVRIVSAITSDLASDDISITDARLVGRFPLSEHVQSLDLEPLEYDGVVEWLERQPMVTLDKPAPVPLDDIGQKIASAFYEASGGNPNVLGLVIRDSYDLERRVSMDDEGHWRTQCDLDTLRRSQSAERLIRARLDRLDADERAVLEISSVIGLEIDGDLLRRVSNRGVDEIDKLLGVARARHFISENDEIQRFETEATRRAIYRIIPPARRADCHEAVAASLTQRASDGQTLVPDVQIARHLSEVAQVHGRRAGAAAEHFLRAARRAIRSEPADAVSLAHEALAVLDKYELMDDGQLRNQASTVVAEAQVKLGVTGSPVGSPARVV